MSQKVVLREAPSIVVTPPGPKSQALLSKQQLLETRAVTYSKSFPFAIESAEGSTIKDVDGNLYIDWVSGVCVLNLGHNNPRVSSAVKSQMDKIWHALEIPTETRIEFLEKMHGVLPKDMRGKAKILNTVTGGDACETAISIARRVSEKRTIIAFEGAYHGIHQGIVSSTASRHHLESSGALREGVFRLPYPYHYRFPLPCENERDAGKVVVDYLNHLLEDSQSGLDDVAGIIVEPVQGEGGYIVPPADFLPALRETCDRFQIPLIADEVQTGFGRTGKFWACELTDTTPDIVCISKGVGEGIPMSLVAYREEYDEVLTEAFHLGTYRGNPLGMAAGSATIDYIKQTNLLERVQKLGTRTKQEFEAIAARTSNVGDVRGVGFMIGNEVVESKQSRKPSKRLAAALSRKMFESGLLMHTCGHYGNVLRFMAPLTIDETLLHSGLTLYERAISSTPLLETS